MRHESLRISPEIAWSMGEHVCALHDSERHLGHAFLAENKWLAFDAVHQNAAGDNFRFLGCFSTLVDAKRAVEMSVLAGDAS